MGTGWKIVKDFQGQPKHSQGGVDITISDSGVSMVAKILRPNTDY